MYTAMATLHEDARCLAFHSYYQDTLEANTTGKIKTTHLFQGND